MEALKCVKECGLNHYEFWGWWEKNVDELLAAQKETGVKPAALCTRFISLTDASQRSAYFKGLQETVEVCERLGIPVIISQVGAELTGISRREQHQSIVDGLKICRQLLADHDLTLASEPLNTKIDHKGYYLTSSQEAFELVDEADSPHIRVLFDIYHQHINEGIDIPHILRHLDRIAHFHIAGYPGRHEPLDPNEIDYPAILKAVRDAGYSGCAGLEYFPVRDAGEGLARWHDAFPG